MEQSWKNTALALAAMLAFASPGPLAAMPKVQVRIKWLPHEREDLCTFTNEKWDSFQSHENLPEERDNHYRDLKSLLLTDGDERLKNLNNWKSHDSSIKLRDQVGVGKG